MRLHAWILPLSLALTLHPAAEPGEAPAPDSIAWQDWSEAAFERAKQEGRFVLLDLGAVWCHWCHVMDETTYQDPDVVRIIAAHYVPVRVDQDARPDLGNRYEDYGWPATVVFDATGGEIVKFRGYIPPERMRSLLETIVRDPTPGPSVTLAPEVRSSGETNLAPSLRDELEALHVSRYDTEHGGWGFSHKYLDADSVEYCLLRARSGDRRAEAMGRETLSKQRKLFDPVWGGVYQYSDSGVWENPHFEKIMFMQAENLRVYSQAYALWRDPDHLQAAREIHRYLKSFLMSPEGAFYASQDADLVPGAHSASYFALSDAERRRRGVPKVDTHVYTRENAWAIHALVTLHGATGDASALEDAVRAATWILAHRARGDGGFRHDDDEIVRGGPYLADTLAAGRAFLSLYAATGNRSWLAHAEEAARFILGHFRQERVPGFVTAQPTSRFDQPTPQREENILLARFANLLFRYTGQAVYREMSQQAFRHLAIPDVARRFSTAGVLLADHELTTDAVHVTVVGAKDDPQTRILHAIALADTPGYRRVELWDPGEGPLPYSDVQYPRLKKAAAFLCSQGRCSAPAYTPEELHKKIERLRSSSAESGLAKAAPPQ